MITTIYSDDGYGDDLVLVALVVVAMKMEMVAASSDEDGGEFHYIFSSAK